MKYVETKEDCQKHIWGVCSRCGGTPEPIETVNNSNEPTFWVGCLHCSCFCTQVTPLVFKIGRALVEKYGFQANHSNSRFEYEDSPERLEYWTDEQTRSACIIVDQVIYMLKQCELNKE